MVTYKISLQLKVKEKKLIKHRKKNKKTKTLIEKYKINRLNKQILQENTENTEIKYGKRCKKKLLKPKKDIKKHDSKGIELSLKSIKIPEGKTMKIYREFQKVLTFYRNSFILIYLYSLCQFTVPDNER